MAIYKFNKSWVVMDLLNYVGKLTLLNQARARLWPT